MNSLNPAKRGISRTATAVLMAVVLGVISSVAAAPIASAATCSGWGCEGKDPQNSGCSSAGAYTAQSYPLVRQSDGAVVGIGELRYSSVCGTNWMRITSYIGAVPMFAAIGHGQNYNNNFGFHNVVYQVGWTDMVYAPTPQVACGYGGLENPNWTGYQEPCA